MCKNDSMMKSNISVKAHDIHIQNKHNAIKIKTFTTRALYLTKIILKVKEVIY